MELSDQGRRNRQRWRYGHPVTDPGPIRSVISLEPETLLPGEVLDNGIVLRTSRAVRPVSEVFSGIAYLRMLAGHRRRLRAAIRQMRAEVEADRARRPVAATPEPVRELKVRPLDKVSPGVRWEDLKLVGCCGCRRDLLGPSCEVYRRSGPYQNRVQRAMPPRAYPTDDGRWMCAECLLRSRSQIR